MTAIRFGKPVALTAGAAAWVLAFRGAPTPFDEWLALPIAMETARPGTFSPGDLLVQGSMNGPFHVYKAAGLLYALGLNVDLVWYALLALSLIALFLAAWRLGGALGLTDAERCMMVLAVAASPVYRGTLNWSAQPMLSFISASIAVPLGVFALAAAFEDRVVVALVSAALAFDVHPSLGLCAGVGALIVLLNSRGWRAVLPGLAAATIVALPNVVYILRHASSATAESNQRLVTVFQSFGYHTFVRDHWKDGYTWYSLCVALAFVGAAKIPLPTGRAARLAVTILTLVAVSWIAVMNLTPFAGALPLLLVRASLLVKPLAIGLAVVAVTRRDYSNVAAVLAPVFAMLAIAHPNPVVGEAALAATLGAVLFDSSGGVRRAVAVTICCCSAGLFLVVVAGHATALAGVASLSSPVRLLTLAVGAGTSVLLALGGSPAATQQGGRYQRTILLAALALPPLAIMLAGSPGRAWLPESVTSTAERIRLSRPLRQEAGAMRWAREHSPPGSLFAVPPVNVNWLRFRVVAERGMYASVHDVNQLTYVPAFVFPLVDRLAVLGVVIRAPHVFDETAFGRPTCVRLQRLAADGVTYYVLPSGSPIPAGPPPVYRDAFYAILDVRGAALTCT